MVCWPSTCGCGAPPTHDRRCPRRHRRSRLPRTVLPAAARAGSGCGGWPPRGRILRGSLALQRSCLLHEGGIVFRFYAGELPRVVLVEQRLDLFGLAFAALLRQQRAYLVDGRQGRRGQRRRRFSVFLDPLWSVGVFPSMLSATSSRLSARLRRPSTTSSRRFVLLMWVLLSRSWGKLREDTVHDREVVALQRRGQLLQKGDLFRAEGGARRMVPVREFDAPAIAAADSLYGNEQVSASMSYLIVRILTFNSAAR